MGNLKFLGDFIILKLFFEKRYMFRKIVTGFGKMGKKNLLQDQMQ
ncbi:hypothetical protein L950_0230525 [Sphingobacterium sp. IITKGP-BTPF85]|nr:hypothetical protein L950_0230525 [Sphingobacterium sp. IITKGP-BTPF85]